MLVDETVDLLPRLSSEAEPPAKRVRIRSAKGAAAAAEDAEKAERLSRRRVREAELLSRAQLKAARGYGSANEWGEPAPFLAPEADNGLEIVSERRSPPVLCFRPPCVRTCARSGADARVCVQWEALRIVGSCSSH